MTQPPIEILEDEDGDPFRARQCRNQQYAEQILKYISSKGSLVELLAFSPTVMRDAELFGRRDDNGHRWPHYYYVRGLSMTKLPGNQYLSQVVAHPVKKSKLTDYVKHFTIL